MLLLLLSYSSNLLYGEQKGKKHTSLKILNQQLDNVHTIMNQLQEFLFIYYSAEDYESTLPDLESLLNTYHLEPEVIIQ